MLSAVLKSQTAVKVSIQIIHAFVEKRRYMCDNALIIARLDNIEKHQMENDVKFNEIFKALEQKDVQPEKGIFFDGQIFDAYQFISDLIRKATKSIILIDNYIDDKVRTMFSKKNEGVNLTILKDLGKKWFAFSKMNSEALLLLNKLNKIY